MKNINRKIKKWFHTKDGVEQNEINKQLIIIIVSIFITVTSVLGVTYSAFVWSDNSVKNQNLVVGNIELAISSESETLGSNLNYPVPQEGETSLAPYTFTISNQGRLASTYQLKIVDESSDSEGNPYTNDLDKNYIYISLDGGATITRTSLATYDDKAIDFGILYPGDTKTYDLRLWIVNNAPNSVIGKQWHGKIVLESKQATGLAEAIVTNNNIQENKTFSTTSTDNGLFKEESIQTIDGKASYYFRGATKNNYVQFGTYKTTDGNNVVNEPIIWRIVRINEDQTIKLISQNNISNSSIWNSSNTSKYVNDDSTNSEIKTLLENWYSANIGNDNILSNRVVTNTFCNDTTGEAYSRLVANMSPTFICPSEAVATNSTVGLITADELMYAGALNKTVTSNTTYLNNGSSFYTITPWSDREIFIWDNENQYLNGVSVSTSNAAARPVINLKADTVIYEGTGENSDPYIIK